MAAVALMDARSIAATAANGGKLTSAWEMEGWGNVPEYEFDGISYKNRGIHGIQQRRWGKGAGLWTEYQGLAGDEPSG
ncbi:MAG: hypothetical protein ACLR0U_03370 [Enterocloster clostridioformis]